MPQEKKSPRPELSGRRLKRPEHDAIYLVDVGFKRLIPDAATYNNLFLGWDDIGTDVDLDELPDGPFLTSGAVLVKCRGTDQHYLVDRGMKRPVNGADVIERYRFNVKKALELPVIILDCIPSGRQVG